MKKLFTLLAMVGLAFASCTPSDPETPAGGEGQEVLGAAEFEMSVTNITTSSADIKITPKAEGRTYYWNIFTEAEMAEYDSTAAIMNEWYEMMVSYVDQGYYDWTGENGLLDQGVVEFTTTKLKPDTKYTLWAFGVDAQGNLTSADLSYVEFQSAVSTFDPASWDGLWSVTSPKKYFQQLNLVTGDYESGILAEELTRNIEVVNGATMDASLEGYALVYGWDGNFLDALPAIGVYNDNKIELLNNEVIYQGDGADYTWIAMSAIPAMGYDCDANVGGEYTPYTLSMDTVGNVTIEAYKGILSTGDEFTVASFTIWPVVGGDIYVWQYEEPVYTFSGEVMTGTRVEGELSSAKKASVKVMHKHANAQFNAKHFTASRFVK